MEKSNGYPRMEPQGREADLKQSVDRPSGESARLAAPKSRPTLSQPGHLLLFDSNGSNGGCSGSHRE